MNHRATRGFWDNLRLLSHGAQASAHRQFAALKANPNHPSLQFKKVGDHRGQELWSARVTLNYRALALKREDGYLRFGIGDHKEYDKIIG